MEQRDPAELTHLDAKGDPRMVDVGAKPVSRRQAIAAGELRVSPQVLRLLASGANKKGEPLAVAQIAGIQAAKRTSELIPLCHPVPIDQIRVLCEPNAEANRIEVRAEIVAEAKTGVEMEALCAASIALLTLYDMLKSADKGMEISSVRLLEKSGGQSGDFKRR